MKRYSRLNKQQGVTLIELMITIVIVGIIAAVAYPSYQSFIQKSRRADGQASLMSFAAAMERHFTVNDTYASTISGSAPSAPLSSVFPSEAPLDGDDKFYDLEVQAVTTSTFTIQAVPKGPQDGDRCGTLTLTHAGARGAGDTDCWP